MDKVVEMVGQVVQSCINSESNLQSLKRKWKNLKSRASDMKEQVSNAEWSAGKKRKREVKNWLKEVKNIKSEFPELEGRVRRGSLGRITTGGDVANMEKRVVELMEQSQHFNGLLRDDNENRGEPRLITKLFGKMFDQNLKRILQCLVTDGISNIGIYGMGGVGKTTLVKHIHNHLLEKTTYRVHWSTISQNFSMKQLQSQIAKFIRLDLYDEEDEGIRAAKLYRRLEKSKNLVLILDDVWESFDLKSVGIPLGANGCKVILTTRYSQLCDRMDCERKFVVNTLNNDEAWELFKFVLGHRTRLDANTEEIAKSITKRCAGLPLGIITMAGSMKGINDIRHWRDALQQLKLYSEGNGEMGGKVFSVLQWSFNRLTKIQQNCFLYCSLYPEDEKICKEELIMLFISAGLMDRREIRKQKFDQGHKVLNELVSACLLEETIDYSNRDCVKMHDLIRNMAIMITSGECTETFSGDRPKFLVKAGLGFTRMPEQKYWINDLDVVSLMHNKILEISPDMSPNCPKLSILILSNAFYLKPIPSSFFCNMITSLRVLDLSFTNFKEVPSCVSDMENLTALLLRGSRLQSVPPLGKLKELRELDLSGVFTLRDVPQGLEMLVNLRYLNMVGTRVMKIPKGTLARLTRLQCLRVERKCSVHIMDVKGLKELEEFSGGRLDQSDVDLPRPSCLTGIFPSLNSSISIFYIYRSEAEFLFNLSSASDELESNSCSQPQNLEELHLSYLPNLVGLVTWGVSGVVPRGTFCNLKVMVIFGAPKLTKLLTRQLAKNLQNLGRLYVSGCEKLEEIIAEDEIEGLQLTLDRTITTSLPKLKSLYLRYLPELKSICKGTLICDTISHIYIFQCRKLKRLPLSLPTIDGQLSCPNALQKIVGAEEWWKSLEWDDPSAKIALQSKFVNSSHCNISVLVLREQMEL